MTKTETAPWGGLDPTVESIGVVEKRYHERRRLSMLDAGGSYSESVSEVRVRGIVRMGIADLGDSQDETCRLAGGGGRSIFRENWTVGAGFVAGRGVGWVFLGVLEQGVEVWRDSDGRLGRLLRVHRPIGAAA